MQSAIPRLTLYPLAHLVAVLLVLYCCSVIQNSNCKVGGQGVITAATFGMLFGLLSIFFLHVDVAGKQFFGKAIRFPRLFLFLFSFLSLTLYIVLVATVQQSKHNTVALHTASLFALIL